MEDGKSKRIGGGGKWEEIAEHLIDKVGTSIEMKWNEIAFPTSNVAAL